MVDVPRNAGYIFCGGYTWTHMLHMLDIYCGGVYLDTHATHAGHILWLMNLEMLGTYSVGGIPRNAGYTSCKGYLPETLNPILK